MGKVEAVEAQAASLLRAEAEAKAQAAEAASRQRAAEALVDAAMEALLRKQRVIEAAGLGGEANEVLDALRGGLAVEAEAAQAQIGAAQAQIGALGLDARTRAIGEARLADEARTAAQAKAEAQRARAEADARQAAAIQAEAKARQAAQAEALKSAKERVGSEYAKTKGIAARILGGEAATGREWQAIARALEAAGVTDAGRAGQVCRTLAVGRVLSAHGLDDSCEGAIRKALEQEFIERAKARKNEKGGNGKAVKITEADFGQSVRVKSDGLTLEQREVAVAEAANLADLAVRLGRPVQGAVKMAKTGLIFTGTVSGQAVQVKVQPGWTNALLS